jgi:hypothetical protein
MKNAIRKDPRRKKYRHLSFRPGDALALRLEAVAAKLGFSVGAVLRICADAHLPKLEK